MLLLLSADPSAELGRGRALVASGELKGAVEQYRRVIAAFPTWGLAHLELADALWQENPDEPDLERILATARTLEPENPRAWLLTARLHDRQGKPAALDEYTTALKLRPELTEARQRQGALLLEAGRAAEAVQSLRTQLAYVPDDRTARANLAEACEKTGELACAEQHLRALVEAAPTNHAYRRRLADFYERTGQPEKAVAEARKAEARPAKKKRVLPPSVR
jgi:predicted Zn-dependent protease